MIASRPRAFVAAVLFALAAAPQARAGHYEDGVYIPDGVCVDPRGCDSSSSSDSGAFQGGPPSIAWGKMTKRASDHVAACGTNPVCKLVRGALTYPIGLAFDAPVFLFKGLAAGGYYAAKGTYYGVRGLGRGIAATGRAVAAPFNRPPKPPTTWEAYKRQVLALQKRLTKADPRNKQNSDWCRSRVPLENSPNRGPWEARCNFRGTVPAAALPPDPVVAAREKAAQCAVGDALRGVEGAGPQGKALAGEIRQELGKVLAELRSKPLSGVDGEVKVFTSGRDYAVKDASGESQVLVKVAVQRDEKSGEVHIDAMTSVSGPGRPETTEQNIIFVDASGNALQKELSPAASACLGG